jgi:hypothetical protein
MEEKEISEEQKKKATIFIVAVICLMALIIYFIDRISVPDSPTSTSTITTNAIPAPDFTIGKKVMLYEEGLKTLLLAIDEKSLDQLIKSSKAKDRYSLSELMAAGKVFTIYNNKEALILDIDYGIDYDKIKVRILEGSRRGKAGWIIETWVKPLK